MIMNTKLKYQQLKEYHLMLPFGLENFLFGQLLIFRELFLVMTASIFKTLRSWILDTPGLPIFDMIRVHPAAASDLVL